mmetsp:Transcript_1834/g.3681  ORF Transcript_1834/g.3681 Transcript_1834/m.3681 type:complete len:155 (+) Transcript_1834:279-743(+)
MVFSNFGQNPIGLQNTTLSQRLREHEERLSALAAPIAEAHVAPLTQLKRTQATAKRPEMEEWRKHSSLGGTPGLGSDTPWSCLNTPMMGDPNTHRTTEHDDTSRICRAAELFEGAPRDAESSRQLVALASAAWIDGNHPFSGNECPESCVGRLN